MGQQTMVILHGWGLTGKRYEAIQKVFEKEGYRVFAPDFPGFGQTPLLKSSMYLSDYVDFLKTYINNKTTQPVILVGHSFGGRVAAKFTATYPKNVSALIVTGAPLIKKPLPLQKKVVQFFAKTAKQLIPSFLEETVRKNTYRLLGEWDYYKAGILKQTLKNILSEDILSYLSYIKVPTLIIWGEKDTFVSATIGKEIAGKIQQARWELIQDATHKLPYENPSLFSEKVLEFLRNTL